MVLCGTSGAVLMAAARPLMEDRRLRSRRRPLRVVISGLREPRVVIFQLQSDGLAASLRKHMEVLDRAHDADVRFTMDGGAVALPEEHEAVVFQLHNALRHASARTIEVRLRTEDGAVVLELADVRAEAVVHVVGQALARSVEQHLASRAETQGALLDLPDDGPHELSADGRTGARCGRFRSACRPVGDRRRRRVRPGRRARQERRRRAARWASRFC
ncbi:hypothetical protein Arub01_52130 [Actinomadura rubrobrunea]|uniref:Uncharacterized protein n=1 Tax=Actinomadura rubrobrunea TaxID=115335 RepID=A0A9W6PYZ5_9ACTN|nr:hypothetical protein Arub01_52130 [Actinomadura rubrobrunea]